MGVIQRQGLKHTIISYAGVVIGLLSVIFIYPREEELYGLYTLIFSSAILCTSFFMLGFNIHAVRSFPVFKNDKNGHNGFLGLLISGGLVGFLLFLISLPLIKYLFLDILFQDSSGRELFESYFYYLIPIVFLFIFNAIFLKYISNFHRIVVPNILDQLLIKINLPILILLFIGDYFTTDMFVKGIIFNYLVVFLGLIIYTKSLGQLHLKTKFDFIKKPLAKEMGENSVFGLLNALGSQIATRIDTLMVAAMVSISAGGVYAIVNVISEVINKPYKGINAIAAPIISKSWNNNDLDEIKKIYQKSSITLLVAGWFIFLGTWLSIDDLFLIMYKSEVMATGKYVILFLGLARLFDLATSVNSFIIIYSKKFRFNFYAILVLAILNIIFNLIFIPKYQIVGAAIATFCSLVLFNLAKLIFIWVQFKMQPFTMATLKILIIVAICWGGIYLIPITFHPIVNILLRSILLTILYGGMVLYFNISPDINNLITNGLEKVRGLLK